MKIYGFDVPEGKGYKWAAVDQAGGVYAYTGKPVIAGKSWVNIGDIRCELLGALGYYPNYKNSLIALTEDLVEDYNEDATQALKAIQQALQGTDEEVIITEDEIAVISNDFVERKGTPEQIVRYIETRKECARIVAEMKVG